MTPQESFFAVLSGEMPERIPLNVWSDTLPKSVSKQELLDFGVCITNKRPVFEVQSDQVEVETRQEQTPDGLPAVRTLYHTPAGTVSTVLEKKGDFFWPRKKLFSEPADYKPLSVLLESQSFVPCFAKFEASANQYGDQTVGRPLSFNCPIHEVIYQYMGLETFSLEWFDNKTKVLGLMDILAEHWRKKLALLAASPARYVAVAGNVEIHSIGLERFDKYYVPYIQEACEVLHEQDKLAGAHLDGDNKLLSPQVAETDLDFVESFTPPPDCDLSVAEARRVWPDKTLIVNFPCSVFLRSRDEVLAMADEILSQASPGDRTIFGVIEDMPACGVEHLVPLLRHVRDVGATPLQSSVV